MMSHLRNIEFRKCHGNKIYLCILSFIISMMLPAIALHAQYPYIIEMSHVMIANATIIAKQEVVHKPGFEVKKGLEYHAYIDPNFEGDGTPYDPPPEPGDVVINPSDLNFIITTSPQIAAFSQTDTTNCNEVTVDITYFDGLGRQLQDVSVMASPTQKDLIKPYSYDAAGRPDSSFLPYVSVNGQNGQFDFNYPVHQKDFTEDMFGSANKDYGFSEPDYEKSSLNRVLKQSAPGSAWALNPQYPDQEHVVDLDYSLNDAEVPGWKVNNNTFSSFNYSPGQLFVNTTQNENNGINRSVTREYKNKSDQLVMVETQSENNWYQTRYIYDDCGLLRCVMTPKASNPNKDTVMCYYYNYDNRFRLISKKLPGADSVLMVYDKRDRLVMSQDGKMRSDDPKQWLMTCYDNFNRIVMTGIYNHSSALSRNQMQDHYNDHVSNLNEAINGNYNDTDHGYTRNVFTALCSSSCNFEVLTVAYYDNYLFAPAGFSFYQNNGIVPVTDKLSIVKNLLTGEKVRVMGEESNMRNWMLSVKYYDDKYRVIQTISDNSCSDGRDTVTSKYSFDGKLEILQTRHFAYSKSIRYTDKFVYDHRGRLLEHTIEGLPNLPKVMLTSMHYNSLGQLSRKQIHSETSGGNFNPFIQKTDYLYNIRGWLTSINNPDSLASDHDIFGMRLNYIDELAGISSQKQFNGNISVIDWRTNHGSERYAYSYNYDNISRMISASFYFGNDNGLSHNSSFDETGLQYDENGNLLMLDRYGNAAQKIDELRYAYLDGGNQIMYGTDNMGDIPNVVDYPGGTTATQAFWYDRNGNLIQSADKGINTDIIYSYLNKPELLDFGNGEKIRYIYDAGGNKLGKLLIDGNAVPESSLIYAGNFVYNWNGILQYITTEEGRIIPEENSFRLEYFMKDHLGNTRATYAQAAPGLPQVAEYNHYYPFGMELESLCYTSGADLPNNHLYNGKELQPEYNLQWYDYGARFYDPQLGRWHCVDPAAEVNRRWSSYNYALDNPVRFIDPDGNDWRDVVNGTARGAVDNLTGWNTRSSYTPTDAAQYNRTLNIMDAGSILTGVMLSTTGGPEVVGGVAAAIATGGPGLGIAVKGALEVAVGSTLMMNGAKNLGKNNYGEKSDNTYDRVEPRKGTKEQVKENQPRNEKGEMLDPNTGQVLDPSKTDLGHKAGSEWRTRKQMHEEKGSTRKEVIKAENDPSLYQYEDRSNNRSHKYEKKQE